MAEQLNHTQENNVRLAMALVHQANTHRVEQAKVWAECVDWFVAHGVDRLTCDLALVHNPYLVARDDG